MPCEDTSSVIHIEIKDQDRLTDFNFAKLTCGKDISVKEKYLQYCSGKKLQDICEISFLETVQHLSIKDEEEQFLFYLQWDALRCAIAQYLGKEIDGIDRARCQIQSIDYHVEGCSVDMIVLPPKEFPEIF